MNGFSWTQRGEEQDVLNQIHNADSARVNRQVYITSINQLTYIVFHCLFLLPALLLGLLAKALQPAFHTLKPQ